MPLLRGIARTAAIAGTATAVSNRVSRRQGTAGHNKKTAEPSNNLSTPRRPLRPPRRPGIRSHSSRISPSSSRQGILTDAEFDAQKAKILAS